VRISLYRSKILVDGEELPRAISSTDMEAIAGTKLSTRAIAMHPSGFRHATVTENGIVWYLDEPEGRVSHFYLAIAPSDAPQIPQRSYSGVVDLDGRELTEDCTEATFLKRFREPLDGHVHSWSYSTAHHYVSFTFERRRNRLGRRAGTYKLSHVSISFNDLDGEHGDAPNREQARDW
jgi:hypothetical protein